MINLDRTKIILFTLNKCNPYMKFNLTVIILFLFFRCTQTKKDENELLIPKNNFSVSLLNKKLDSIRKNHVKNDSSNILLLDRYDKRLNKNYLHGAIHFVIVDKNISYYAIDTFKPTVLMCGNQPSFSKQDSLIFIEKSNVFADKLQKIKTTEIIKILAQNKAAITQKSNGTPLNISFALKNDTLKGSTIYDIVSFMENNGMEFYTFRRMNNYELIKAK